MLHLSYVFCRAWQFYSTEPVGGIGAAAIGSGADPIELMREPGGAPGRRMLARTCDGVPPVRRPGEHGAGRDTEAAEAASEVSAV